MVTTGLVQTVIQAMIQTKYQTPLSLLFQGGLSCWVLGITSVPTHAQIVPDRTLPSNTIITPNGTLIKIEGGTQTGSNLFHSFQEFSVNTGTTAFFNNVPEIQNIISRVTGSNLSNIDGLIQANGMANLYLLNPNGIIFGPNAQLNIGGSFIGSTADRVLFNDGTTFNAVNPSANPLLTVNVPVGLQLGATSPTIVNRSQAMGIGLDGMPTTTGLQVQPGQAIVLIGGNVSLEGGYLTAFDGRIELGALQNGIWPLDAGMPVQATQIQFNSLQPSDLQPTQTGQIQLFGGSQVNTSGASGGEIRVQGDTVFLTEGSSFTANTFGPFSGGGVNIQASRLRLQNRAFVSASTFLDSGDAGGITVNANRVELIGVAPFQLIEQLLSLVNPDPAGTGFDPTQPQDGLYSFSGGSGKAGDIVINANQLIVSNGTGIATTALLEGQGGNLQLNIAQVADLQGGSILLTGSAGSGASGNFVLNTPQLWVLNGTVLTTATINQDNPALGGDIIINADQIELRGTPGGAITPGGVFATTLGLGNAGDLTINSRQLTVADGAQVSASSSGAGQGGNLTVNAEFIELSGLSPDGRFLSGLLTSSSLLTVQGRRGTAGAGNLTVDTNRLVLQNGAQISAATGGEGEAGDLRIRATESLEVSGFATNVDPSVEKVSFGVIGDGIIPTAIESNTSGSGTAGDLTIQTGQLMVRDGAEIGVRGTGIGSAGNLTVSANSIRLSNAGTLSAATNSGTQGNIVLQAREVELRQGSRISTNSRTANGGNITMATDLVLALENSDITANAEQGQGGRVVISAQGILGTQFQEQQTPASDITATSELGAEFSGIVEINRPEADPSAGLVDLPDEVIDPATLVIASCDSYAGSEFTLVGRGGLPPSPNDAFTSSGLVIGWIDWVEREHSQMPEHQEQEPTGFNPSSHPGTDSSLDRSLSLNSQPHPQSPSLKPLSVLIEAQGWVFQPDGTVELVARPEQATLQRSGFNPQDCQAQGMSDSETSP
ncbi:MAG: filamentous hemagglutinin N-terminal domain-containing protein [Microcoleaceae cyanobacterium]